MKKPKSDIIVGKMFTFLLPTQVMSYAVLFVSSLIDNFIIGNYVNMDSVAVLSIVMPLTLIVSMLGGVISSGSQILFGRSAGRGDLKNSNIIFSTAVALCVIMGTGCFIVCMAFPHQLAVILGAGDEALALEAVEYIRGISIGFVFMMFYKAVLSFLQLDNAPKTAFSATLVMIVTKAFFDILGIFVLKNGMFGVGLSTSLAYFAASVIGIVHHVRPKSSIRFALNGVNPHCAFQILTLGVPNAVIEICLAVRAAVINRFAYRYGGSASVSAFGIASTIAEILYSGINGHGNCVNIVSSVFFGSLDKVSMNNTVSVGLKRGIGINIIAVAASFIIARPAASLLGATGAVADEAVKACILIVGAALFDPLPVITNNIYKSIGFLKEVNIFYTIQYLIIPVIVCFTLPQHIGTTGIWLLYIIQDALGAAGMIVYSSVRRGRFPKNASELVYIPDSVYEDGARRYSSFITADTDTALLKEDIKRFCRESGAEEEAIICADTVVGAVDEIVKHGFENKKCGFDLRLKYANGELTATVRDNGKRVELPDLYGRVNVAYSLSFGMNMYTFVF